MSGAGQQTREPIARIGMLGATIYLAGTAPGPFRVGAAESEMQPVILIATPALPQGFAPIVDQGDQGTPIPTTTVPTPQPEGDPVAQLAAPTVYTNWIQPPTATAEPQAGDGYTAAAGQAPAGETAPQGPSNPYEGMETVNGQSFVEVNPYAGMETTDPDQLAQAQAAADAYKELPTVQFDNAPAEPNRQPMPKGVGTR